MTRRSSRESRFTAMSNPLPLIPAPKSFLERQASLSLSTSSLSSSKNSRQFPSSHPPSPPPPVLIYEKFPSNVSLPSPPPSSTNNNSNNSRTDAPIAAYSEQQLSSLASESYTGKSQSPDSLSATALPLFIPLSSSQSPSPLPSYPPSVAPSPSSSSAASFEFPPPPSTSPSPVPHSQTLSYDINTSVSSPTMLSPKPNGREDRTHSVSPSEVVGYLDQAIGDHAFSVSSYNDGIEYPEFSPAFHFSSASTPVLTPVQEPREMKKYMEEEVFFSGKENYIREQYNENALSHKNIMTSKSYDNVDADETRVGTQQINPKISDTEHSVERIEFSDGHFGAQIPILSPTSREKSKRKPSLTPKKVAVSKLKQDLKTVRQQIKPGTVGELANLFTYMTEEHVTSPSKPEFDFNIRETVDKLESLDRDNEEQLALIAARKYSRSLSHGELPFKLQNSKLNEINSTLHQPQQTFTLKQSPELSMVQPNPSLDVSSGLPDPRAMPGLDFLSASREIFKHVVSNKSNSKTNSAKRENMSDDEKADAYISTQENTLPSGTAATISSSNTASESKHTRGVHSPSHANTTGRYYLTTPEQEGYPTQPFYSTNTGESASKVFLKYEADDEESASTFNKMTKKYRAHDTPSQNVPPSLDVSSPKTDEVSRIMASPKWKTGSTMNSINLRSKSLEASDAEPLVTLTNSKNINNSIHINNGQQLTLVSNNNTSNDTPGSTETGSEIQVQTNQASLHSQVFSGTQVSSQVKRDSGFRETRSEHWTGSSSLEDLKVWTTVDTTSNHDVTMSDSGAGTIPSQVSRSDHTCSDEGRVVDGDVPGTGMSVIHGEEDISIHSSSINNYNSADEKGDFNGIQHEVHEILGNIQKDADAAHEVRQTEEDLQLETVQDTEAGLFVQPVYSSQKTEEFVSTTDRDENTDNVVLKNTANKSLSPMFSKLSPVEHRNVDTETDGDVNKLNGDSSAQKDSDDFLSLLDDIKIETDITSSFLRSSRRSGHYSPERQQDDQEVASDPEYKQAISNETYAAQLVMEENVQGIYNEKVFEAENLHHSLVEMNTKGKVGDNTQFDLTANESSEISAATITTLTAEDLDLNEEIRKQHSILSAMASDHTEDKKSFNFDLRGTRHTRNSISSTHSSGKTDNSSITKETLFNNEFFSGSEALAETNNNNELFKNSENINGTKNRPESDWIVPAENSRSIPWSEYEEKAEIQFQIPACEKEPNYDFEETSSQQHEDQYAAFHSEIFSKSEAITNTENQSLPIQESLIEAISISRLIPWANAKERLEAEKANTSEYSMNNVHDQAETKITSFTSDFFKKSELNEEHTPVLLTAETSQEEENYIKKTEDDDSDLFSKDKFQALRNVFQAQQLENQSKSTHKSSQAKQSSFKFTTNPSSPPPGVSGSKNEENGEMSIQDGRNVASQLETRERWSRDTDYKGVDIHLQPYRSTEIDTSEERDSEHSDSSNESTSGSDVDTLSTRRSKKKSKQTNLSYDLQTGELSHSSLSRSSNLETSSLFEGSVKKGHFETASSDITSDSAHSSLEPGTVSRIKETFSDKSVPDNELKDSVKTFSAYIPSTTGKRDILTQNSADESSGKRVKDWSSRNSLQEVETGSERRDDKLNSSSNGGNFSDVIQEISRRQQNSVNSTSGKNRSPLSGSEIENSDTYSGEVRGSTKTRFSSHTEIETYKETGNDSLDFGDRVRRRSSTESDKQTELINVFLSSSVGVSGPERDSVSWNTNESSVKLTSHVNADINSVTSHLLKESPDHLQQNGSYSNNQHKHVYSDGYNLPSKVNTDNSRETAIDNSEHNFPRTVSKDSRHNEEMTAIVGEVSSFSIHKKITSHEESFSEQAENFNNAVTAGGSLAKHDKQPDSDIYLIQDDKGDYYALQEVDGGQTNGNVLGRSANLHVLENRTEGRLNGHVSNGLSSTNDYYPSEGARTDLYIDSSAVQDDKAREVISAYLDAQDSSRQRVSNNDVHTFQETSTLSKHHYLHTDEGGRWDSSTADAPTLLSSSSNHGSVVVQQTGYGGVTSDEHFSSRSYANSHLRHENDGLLKNLAGKADNSQLNKSGPEHFASDSVDQNSYTSSLRLTNLRSPQAHLGHSTVVDTAYDNHRSGGYSTIAASNIQHHTDSIDHVRDNSAVNPYLTTPMTITTTTQAVVGEHVGMHIDYSPTVGADTFYSSSDDESKQKRYVVRNIPQKSSLKKSSSHNTSSFSDSSSDIIFAKVGTSAADFNHSGNNRGTILQSHDTREMRNVNESDSLSPRSVVNGPIYRVYQSPQSTVSPNDGRGYHKQGVHEKSFSLSRETEGNNLYRVRNLSTSVPDGLHNSKDHRGRSGSRSSNYSDSQKTYKITRKQHHSPERFFKNAKLSLRKDDYDDNDYYSEEEGDNKLYRTVTKVHLNENQPSSRPQSPDTRYKVSSLQTQASFENVRNQVAENDRRMYEVVTVKPSDHQTNGFTDETDSGYQKKQPRYKVISTADSSKKRREVRAHSIPKLEEATITRTESVQPSRLNHNPPSTKKHKTVIQLEVAGNKIVERKTSEEMEPLYMLQRAKSFNDLSSTKTVVNVLNHSSDDRKMWRTGKSSSTDKYRGRSSSGDADDDSDLERTESPRFVKTLKQKDGNKMYVVNSTVGDPREKNGHAIHPPGWYKSTIDINEEKVKQDDQFITHRLNEERVDSQNYRTEKTVYFVRETTPQTNGGKVFQRTHSTEFVYPDSGQGTEIASSDGEHETRQKTERVERIYEIRSEPQLPEQFHSMEDLSNDLRVLRGNILIKNRLSDTDHGEDDFDENVNLFDNSFHLGKDNPLFSSDQDLLASLQREEEEEMSKHVHQDITFESVDKIAHEFRGDRQVQTKPPQQRKKQNLSALLLSKLANVDSKDIRQTIDVEHHNEEIFGDIDFIHADGQRKPSTNTRNFDSVNEKVELTLTQGKAYVIIKVIAERIVPTDYEFNVWRKSQAIVTRQIEIDLLANEQRRRLYKDVMASAGTAGSLESGSRSHYYDTETLSPQERQLSSMETLKLFSQILDVADGQGDKDYTQTQTRQEMGQLPPSAMDLLY